MFVIQKESMFVTLVNMIFVLLLFARSVKCDKFCQAGEILYKSSHGPDVCIPCPDGYFMPFQRNNNRTCFPCTTRNMAAEVVVSECNKTHETVFACSNGYYRTQPNYPNHRGECVQCRECPFPQRPCQKSSDTVCCDSRDHDVYIDKSGQPRCVKTCGQGQFFEATTENCLPCPLNTYMNWTRHTQSYCLSCDFPRSEHEKILQSCNSTHPALIGCQTGYYRTPYKNIFFSSCFPCQNCSSNVDGNIFKGRECSQFQDTVCCPQPNMTVLDTRDGQRCVLLLTTTAVSTNVRMNKAIFNARYPLNSDDEEAGDLWKIFGLAELVVLLFIAVVAFCLWYRWKKSREKSKDTNPMIKPKTRSLLENVSGHDETQRTIMI